MGYTWRRNLPMASNMGRFLERQICSTQNILDSLLITHGERLNNESLRTQVENILILGQEHVNPLVM